MQAPCHHRHRQELGPVGPEDPHRPRVGGLLDGHEVARIQQRARHQIEALLGAVHDQDLLGAHLEAEAEQVTGQVLAERRVAARGVVLQELPPFVADHAVEHAPERVGGEEARVGHPAGEGDDARHGSRHLAVGEPSPGIGRDHLGALGQEPGPVESGRRRPRRLGPGRNLVGDEGPLPDVGPRPPARHQLVIGQGDRGPVDSQLPRELPRGGELDARGEQSAADQSFDVELDLPRERLSPGPILASVQGNPHDSSPFLPQSIASKPPIG